MATTQLRPSRVKWVNNVTNETHQLLKRFDQEGKERASEVKRNDSAVKLFLNESEKDRLATARETMTGIKNKLQQLRQEEKEIIKDAHNLMRKIAEDNRKIAEENKGLAGGVEKFLTHSETERQATYKAMMEELHQSIRELRERTKEIRRESAKLLGQMAGGNGTLKTEMKKFLSESEAARKRDFNKTMEEIKAVVNEIQDYEREEKRLAGHTGTGIKEVSSDVVKKKEVATEESKPEKKAAIEEAKPEKKVTMEGKVKVETERKKLLTPACKKCGTQHWSFQKCPQEKSSFKKKK